MTWKDVQKKLKRKEAAIEIIRIKKFGVQKIVTDTTDYMKNPQGFKNLAGFPKYPLYGLTDTVYYAALIVKKKSNTPELVLLPNGNELEDKLFKIYQNSILHKVTDKQSYDAYWKPIQEKLQGIKKVYFSPDGVYNQLNLNVLQNSANQHYVLDELEIQQVTNTKDLLTFQDTKKDFKYATDFKAVLFGRPAYNMDTISYAKMMLPTKDNAQNYLLVANRGLQKGSFTDLVGTEKEVTMIDSILRTKQLATEKYLFKEATETRLKSLQNPAILHIATHGFFVTDSATNNPMLNSGIVLAGVSNYYRSEVKPDTDDGILTASEAQNLSLDRTELVVLSACETAVGEVRNGEGVYGLQRAFKAAGAKSMLMSLWSVNDQTTQELMTLFYENWVKTGNRRDAFRYAQEELRKKYPDPYYWGAFVMIGE